MFGETATDVLREEKVAATNFCRPFVDYVSPYTGDVVLLVWHSSTFGALPRICQPSQSNVEHAGSITVSSWIVVALHFVKPWDYVLVELLFRKNSERIQHSKYCDIFRG